MEATLYLKKRYGTPFQVTVKEGGGGNQYLIWYGDDDGNVRAVEVQACVIDEHHKALSGPLAVEVYQPEKQKGLAGMS